MPSAEDIKKELRAKANWSFVYVTGEDVTGLKHPTNYIESMIHMVKGFVGTGIFAMGAAFLYSGILLGPVFLLCIGVICLHCQHILVNASAQIEDASPVIPSYAEIVRFTFENSGSSKFKKCAKVASVATTVFLVLTKYGVSIVYLIFISSHVKEIADSHGWSMNYRVWLAILIVPIWLPTILSNLKYLAPFSLFANLLIFAGIGILFYYTSQGLDPIGNRPVVANFKDWPKFLGIALFAFMGIAFILNIRMEMRHRDQFMTPFGVLNMSMLLVALLYFSVGFMSYWKYGKCIKGSTFLNFPHEDILAQVTKVAIALAIVFSYTFQMYIPFEILYPIFYKKYGPFKKPALNMALFRTFWVFVTYLIANIDDRLDSFIGLIGGIAGAAVSLLFPALIDLAMCCKNLKVWIIIKDVLIIILAVVGAITASALSMLDIIDHIKITIKASGNDTCEP